MPRVTAPLTEEQCAAIRAAHEAGKSIGEISRELGITERRVAPIADPAAHAKSLERARELRKLRAEGACVLTRRGRQPACAPDDGQVAALVRDSKSARFVALELKVSRRQAAQAVARVREAQAAEAYLEKLIEELSVE